MVWFIVGIILALLGAAGLWYRAVSSDYEDRNIGLAAGIIGLGVGVVMIFLTTFSVVPPRNIGIPVAFGSPGVAVDNGWTWVAPWETVELVDATTQTVSRDADFKNPVTVRLGNQTTADVDLVLQWRIDPANAKEVWQKYRGKDPDALIATVQSKVVEAQLGGAVREALKTHDPLGDAIAGKDSALSYPEMSRQIEALLRPSLDKGVILDKVAVQFIHYDGPTQEKLNAYAQEKANTQLAAQRVKTAEQQRLANEKLATSNSTTNPGVLYQNCLNLVAELATKGQLQNLPATFTCNTGSTTPVIVGGK